MNIGITGASGFIGQRIATLNAGEHALTAYSRNPDNTVPGCRETRRFSYDSLDASGLDAVIHLAGESVLGLWTESKRRKIRDSRVLGTRAVVGGIADAKHKPGVLVCASAIGFYGNTGDEVIDESAPSGEGFLAEVSREWEAEAMKAEDFGCRVVILRIGFVVASTGGAMDMLKPVFQFGLGGKLGSGNQWMSLVHADDVAGMALWALQSDVRGPLNACLPEPVRNADFTARLSAALHRPAILHTPSFLLKSGLGEFSTLLLDSHRILPARPLNAGYSFRYRTVESALMESLKQ